MPAGDTIASEAHLSRGLDERLLALRMRAWRTLQVFDQPIVWVLHVAHLWLVVSMGLLAALHFDVPMLPSTPLHAMTAGAIGTMVLAIMTRASLGHTGRPLRVSPPITLAYLLVTVGALLRTLGPLWPRSDYPAVILWSGAAWSLAYLPFSVVYAPVLLRPRADGIT